MEALASAHAMQTRENDALLHGFGGDGAMIAAGDFNNYRAGDRIGRFANDPAPAAGRSTGTGQAGEMGAR